MFLSRGDRNLGVAFQTHPGSQASSCVEAKNSALLLSLDGYLLEPTEWPKGSQASCEVWRDDSGHAGNEGPHLVMMGEPHCFSRAAATVWAADVQPRLIQGFRSWDGVGEDQDTIASITY